MKKFILLILLLSSILPAYAQDTQGFKQTYENGKELFKMERYGLAMQALKPLTSSFNDNPYIRHASFYYAVSAYHEKQYDIAAAMLNQIKSSFPEWEQTDEVNLWLSKIHNKKKDYGKAIAVAQQIKNPQVKAYANEVLANDFSSIQSFDSLNTLSNQYPDNKEVAVSLAKFIAKQPLSEQDRNLLFDLMEKFDLDSEKLNLVQTAKSEKKDTYNVAVLLPFMSSDLFQSRSNIRNQFVIDLYQGLLLGHDELKSMGVKVNIYSYDTENSSQKTREILKLPELQHIGLIYGPLYPNPVLLANQFSFDYKVNMFNPLSSNQQVVGNNPHAFLYMSTPETQGQQCAEYLLKNLKKKAGIVFYGEDEKDSVLAHSFVQTFHAAGDSSIYVKKIEESQTKRIIDLLTAGAKVELEPGEEGRPSKSGILFKIPRDSLGFIFVASESPALASSTITAMETRGDSTLLIGKEGWLQSQVISYETLERLKAVLIAPTFIDYNSDSYQYFNNIYKEKYNALPTKNACIGYETIILLGSLLNKYGDHFENEFDGSIKGSLFRKYTLDRKNSNQYVPLVRFVNAELKLLNP